MFKHIKIISRKYLLWVIFALIILTTLLVFIINCIGITSVSDRDIFSYSVKVRDSVEYLDKIFERAEVNVNVMTDSIAGTYDTNKLKDKNYNFNFIKSIDGLVKAALLNSPNVDGAWFQLNADLPFSVQAYNWYEFKDDQFVNIKEQFEDAHSPDRKITPADDPYYFDAINNQELTWSAIYTDADTNDSMITISEPIYKNGMLIGVVGIDISLANLQEALTSMQLVLSNSDLYLLDKNNNLILSQLTKDTNLNKNDCKFLSLFKENKVEPIEYYDHLTKKTAIMLVLSNDYKLVISMDNKLLFKGASQLIKIIYAMFALLLIITVISLVEYFKLIKLSQQNINTDKTKDEDEEEQEEEI